MSNPTLTQTIAIESRGIDQVSSQFERLNRRLQVYGRHLNNTASSQDRQREAMSRYTDQGLANIQTGLLQVTTFAMNLGQKIDNLFEKATNRFMSAEQAMTQLRLTMGIMGKRNKANEALYRDYERIEKVVNKLAATTRFTKVEVANAFTSISRAGRSVEEALAILPSTLKFVSASAGQLTLDEGIDNAILSYSTLGGSVEKVEENLNRLYKVTQKTPFGFEDLKQYLVGIRSATLNLGESRDAEANILALGAALKFAKLEGREAGGLINQFSENLISMMSELDKNVLRKSALGKVSKRFSRKRTGIFQLLGIADKDGKVFEKFDRAFLQKELDTEEKNVKVLLDKYARSFFIEQKDGKEMRKDPIDILSMLLDRYRILSEKYGTQATRIVKTAFGQKAGPQVLKNLMKYLADVQQSIGASSYEEYVKFLSETNEEITKAQKESLGDLASKAVILESAYDSLYQGIMRHDVYGKEALETHTSIINTVDGLIRSNDSLAVSLTAVGRVAQAMTGFITNIGFALVAAATFSIGFRYAADTTARSMRGLGGVLRAFHEVFLAPALRVLFLFTGGLLTGGVFLVAFMRHISGAEGIGQGFKKVLGGIKASIENIVALGKLAFSDKFGEGTAKEKFDDYLKLSEKHAQYIVAQKAAKSKKDEALLEKEIRTVKAKMVEYEKVMGSKGATSLLSTQLTNSKDIERLSVVVSKIKTAFSVVTNLFEGMLVPIGYTIGEVIDFVMLFAKIILFPFVAIGRAFGMLDDSDLGKATLQIIGGMIGAFLGLKLIVGIVSASFGGLFGMLSGAFTRGNALRNNILQLRTAYADLNTQTNIIGGHALPRLNTSGQRHLGTLDRLFLGYYKLTGQQGKYGALSARITQHNIVDSQGRRVNAQAIRLQSVELGRLNQQYTLGIGRLGVFNAALMTTSALGMFLGDSLGETGSKFFTMVMNVSILTSAVSSLAHVLGFTMPAALVTLAGSLMPVLLAIGGLLLLAILVKKMGESFQQKRNSKAVEGQGSFTPTVTKEAPKSLLASSSTSVVNNHNYYDRSTLNFHNDKDPADTAIRAKSLRETYSKRPTNTSFADYTG